jgi:hypothetical protein
MGYTDIQIINMALGHLGETQFIQARTELSNERLVAEIYYDPSLQLILEGFAWPETTKYGALGLVEEAPNDDWLYSYRYPSDCLMMRRIITILGRQEPDPPPWITGQDDAGRLIYTNVSEAVAEYTKAISVGKFSAYMAAALSWWLAGEMCAGMARDRKLAQSCYQMADSLNVRAQAKARNESQDYPELDSEAMRARL